MSTGADLFEQLVARLREEGLPTDPEGLADALWLCERMGPPPPHPEPVPAPDPPPAAGRRPVTPSPDPTAPPAPTTADPPAEAAGPPGQDVPAARPPLTAAPVGPVPLDRALRPLRYRPRARAVPGDLDEDATAETSARSGHITPVFHQVRRRETQLLLVMDDSPSMVVWDRMLDELRQVCQQVGAFRDVSVHYLRPRHDGEAGISAGPGGLAPVVPADRLRDPTGRTVLLLLSDCSGALWRHGAAQRLLHRFARTGPVAVLQPLPQRMWHRTLLAAEPGLLRGTEGPGGRLEFSPRRRRFRGCLPGALAVPVLSPTRAALGAWARAVAGTACSTLDAAAAWVHEFDPGTEPPPFPERNPEQLVQDFQAVSSPAAQDLAVYLSAAPLAYPVMRLVQSAMMPQTGPVELAEVLLGGLLLREDERPPTVPPQRDARTAALVEAGRRVGPWYEFAPGVQDVLLRRLGLGEASLVLKHCSLYVERVFGRRAPNVPAMVVGYLAGGNPAPLGLPGAAVPPGPAAAPPAATGPATAPVLAVLPDTGPVAVPRAFAEVPRKVLRRFQPGGVGPAEFDDAGDSPVTPPGGVVIAHRGRVVDTARERLRRFRDLATIRDLWEAIRLLRTAPADADRPAVTVELWSLLAECLLALWTARQGDETLAEADATARAAAELADRAAVAPDLAGRAHLVRGRILRAVAAGPDPTGRSARALDEASAHLTRAELLLRGAPADLLAARMSLVEVARERYAQSADRRPLLQARARLDAVLETWPEGEPVPVGALCARAGLLHALAEDAVRRGTADQARGYARRAVADFAKVAARIADPAAEPFVERARVLLDLAAARAVAAGDQGAPEVLAELDRALAAAGDHGGLRLTALRRLGRAHAAAYARDLDIAELAAADAALTAAQRLVPTDDPDRSVLLAERGEVLVALAGPGGAPAAATAAVRVLREALAGTPEGDPALSARRLAFGRALRARYATGGAPTDLHEAEWILARAARAARDGGTAAQAWLERGDVLLALVHGTGADRLADAADAYCQAARAADQARAWRPAARAHHQQGVVLEESADPAALDAYRAAWSRWQRAAATADPAARATLDRLTTLSGDAPTGFGAL